MLRAGLHVLMRLAPGLALGLAVALGTAAPAAAVPPALLWQAEAEPESTPRAATLVVHLDRAGARLLAGTVVPGRVKLKTRAPREGGLLFVVRDALGSPLAIGQTDDARFIIHGDEPDPATGTLRSLSVRQDETTFLLRIPLPDGATDVLLAECAIAGRVPAVDELLGFAMSLDASLVVRGILPLAGVLGDPAP